MILRLGEVDIHDTNTSGGKGANLGELIKHGFPVPPGFIVSANAYTRFLDHISFDLDKNLKNLGTTSDYSTVCSSIRTKIIGSELPFGLSEKILSAYRELIKTRGTDILCAVRSSATAEDLGDASFAGQHETYYYINEPRLIQMIKHCWASLWNPEAVSYRSARGIDHASVSMAVVVQEMVMSEISGVTFTANPVTGYRNEIVTEASWGMGAALVEGRVTPDHYIVERAGLIVREKRIAEKKFMVYPRPDDKAGTRLREIPYDMRRKETLSPEMIKVVSEWALKAENHFGKPQDVEWAISGGKFFLLQSRPITVMGREEIGKDIKGPHVIFKPLLENFTEPLTPLSSDVSSIVMPPFLPQVEGWIYIDLRYLWPFSPHKISDQTLADLFYDADREPPRLKLSLVKLPLFALTMFLSYLTTGHFLARTRWLPDNYMDQFRDLCRKVDESPAYGIAETGARLWAWSWMRFFDPAGNMPVLTNITSMRYILGVYALNNLLRRWAPGLNFDAAVLCSGTPGILSAEMGRDIRNLATEAMHNRAVLEIFKNHNPEKMLVQLRSSPEAARFLAKFDQFIKMYGHRGVKELELRSPRWEEDPVPVLGMIKNYLLAETLSDEDEKNAAPERAEHEAELRQKLMRHPLERMFGLRWRLIKRLIERTGYFIKLRENTRFYHALALTTVRKRILRQEAALLLEGKLKCRDDIFFLKVSEITRLQSGEWGWLDVEEMIRKRRLKHVRLSKMLPPKTLGIKIETKSDALHTGSPVFRGHSASPGKVEGRARIILDPCTEVRLLPGEILVAPYTDPAWTPLFLTAGAVVVEIGSYLSHAGTVAREYGIPCVVDVPGCTSMIQSGTRLKVDGDSGEVWILSEPCGEKL